MNIIMMKALTFTAMKILQMRGLNLMGQMRKGGILLMEEEFEGKDSFKLKGDNTLPKTCCLPFVLPSSLTWDLTMKLNSSTPFLLLPG